MTNTGIVMSVEGENALIKVTRKSACSSCEGRQACEGSLVGDCMKTAEVTTIAKNPINAKVGDVVEFTSSTSMTLGIAATVFLLPLIVGFLSYYFSAVLINSTIYPYIISLAFFIASFFALFFGIDRMLKGKIKTTVTKILEDEKMTI